MANYYVYSGAAGGATGADWANAYLTMTAAFSGKVAGDVFYVAHDHAESTGATLTLTSPGTLAAPCKIFCADRAGSTPPVSADLRTTASIITTGNFAVTINGTSCWHGVTITAGSGANGPNFTISGTGNYFRNCLIGTAGTTGFASLNVVNGATIRTVLDNTQVRFGGANHVLTGAGYLHWQNTASAIQGTAPTLLFSQSHNGVAFLEGVDLSAMGSGKSLVSAPSQAGKYTFKDCKFGDSVTPATTPSADGGCRITVIRCDSADTNYRTENYSYQGAQTTESTIVRTGGASDGTTTISWKIVTTANSRWEVPFESLPITVWNETVGSAITVTVQGIWGGGAVPNNDEIWIDVEYLGTSGFPLASKATSTKADGLAAGSAIPAGSGTWGGSTTKFAMSATFTPQEKGPLTIYVRAARASSTFYVDPQPVVT